MHPKELEEGLLCQKMFSPLTEKLVYHYKLGLYSDEFKHELKGLFASANDRAKGSFTSDLSTKDTRPRHKVESGDLLPLLNGEAAPLPKEIAVISWLCTRCNVHFRIETVNPFKASPCPKCLKMNKCRLIDYKVK